MKRSRRRRGARRRESIGAAALKGAIAGIAGGVAMLVMGEVEARAGAGELGAAAREVVGGPQTRGGRRRRRQDAPSRHPRGVAVQLAAAAAVGAAYGVVRSRLRLPEAAHGALLGGLALAANASGFVPGADFLAPPAGASLKEALMPVGAHALFGTTTARVFDLLGGELW